ncbi:hypothetical protein AF71_00056720 [Rhizobium sp. 57MFTsu3.2]|nr:hypothetical protein [Rhizobium sp. 57MFTsu3.2]
MHTQQVSKYSQSNGAETALTLIRRFRFYKPHFWLACRNRDRFSVAHIVLLALDKRPDVLWRNQLHLVAIGRQLACPKKGTPASFKNNDGRGLTLHELYELAT